MKKTLCILFSTLCLSLSACSVDAPLADGSTLERGGSLRSWNELSARLQKDGLDAEKTEALFSSLETPPSLSPMGTKIKELYTIQFMPKPAPASEAQKADAKSTAKKPAASPLGVPGPWFKDTVTRANAQRCREFIRSNSSAFALAEKKYGVPREIGAALLFVETRLGTFLGKENAFYSLASMSVKRSSESIAHYLDDMPGIWNRLGWVDEKAEEKSEWAYRELKALLEYCWANGIDPRTVPGSIYGAVGMCQFMPSNIARFAEDGNGDGVIDLFSAPDAIMSLSRYLSLNGWKRGLSLEGQTKVLMNYNRMLKYARTILALAKTIELIEKPAPQPQKKAAAKKAAAKSGKKKALPPKTSVKKKSLPSKDKPKNKAQTLKQKRWVSSKGRDVTAYID
ncbi:MAG: lytic murein transglycosylase [Mailhella sp.]|nr:lytic murein transglycosylase [Mailhella sp.]